MTETSEKIITSGTIIINFIVKQSESLSNIVDDMKELSDVPEYFYTTKKDYLIQCLDTIKNSKDSILNSLKFDSSSIKSLFVFKVSKPIPKLSPKLIINSSTLLSRHKTGRIRTSRFTKSPTHSNKLGYLSQLPQGRIGSTRFSKYTVYGSKNRHKKKANNKSKRYKKK